MDRNIVDISSISHLFVDPRNAEGIDKDGGVICWPQIVVNNVPKNCGRKDIERYFESVKTRKVKSVPQKTFCFVTFDSDEDKDACIAYINANNFKGCRLEAQMRTMNSRDDRDNNQNNKRGRDDKGNHGNDKRSKSASGDAAAVIPAMTSAKNAVCPLWNLPYEQQCKQKADEMRRDCLLELVKSVKVSYKGGGKVPAWVNQMELFYPAKHVVDDCAGSTNIAIPPNQIEVLDLVRSPQVNGYRNKCEFTFGHCLKPVAPAVGSEDQSYSEVRVQSLGFRCNSTERGVEIATPYDCLNIPNAKKLLVKHFLSFLHRTGSVDSAGESTNLKVYDNDTRIGVYRMLTTRYSRTTGDFIVMLTVSLRTTESSLWLQEVQELSEMLQNLKRPENVDNEDINIIDVITAAENGGVAVSYTDKPLLTGFIVQVFDGLSVAHSDHPTIRIFGQEYITEHMLNCQFQVSPQAFFQVNTPAAEVLYQTAIDEVRTTAAGNVQSTNSNSCILDICCGTGTIGLCASKQLQQMESSAASANVTSHSHLIIGVDCCASAIDNANVNAGLNQVTLHTGDNYKNKTVAAFVACKAEAILGGLLGSYTINTAKKIGIPGKSAPATAPSSTDSKSMLGSLRELLGKSLYGQCYAIVDPPREGLHPDCLKAIRNCAAIQRLVYISCNPTKSLVRDSVTLCGQNNSSVPPFRPSRAIPLDLFPHTVHCEMVLMFDRVEVPVAVAPLPTLASMLSTSSAPVAVSVVNAVAEDVKVENV